MTEWNKTLTEARVLKRINNDVAISYQVESRDRDNISFSLFTVNLLFHGNT